MDAKPFDGRPLTELGRWIVTAASLSEVVDLLVQNHGADSVFAALDKHRKKPEIPWPVYVAQITAVSVVRAGFALKSDQKACEKIARILGEGNGPALRQKVVRARRALKETGTVDKLGLVLDSQLLARHHEDAMSEWRQSCRPFNSWVRDFLKNYAGSGESPFQS